MVVHSSRDKSSRTAPRHDDVDRQLSSSNATSNFFLNVPQRLWMLTKPGSTSSIGTSSQTADSIVQTPTNNPRPVNQVVMREAQGVPTFNTKARIHRQPAPASRNDCEDTNQKDVQRGPAPLDRPCSVNSAQAEGAQTCHSTAQVAETLNDGTITESGLSARASLAVATGQAAPSGHESTSTMPPADQLEQHKVLPSHSNGEPSKAPIAITDTTAASPEMVSLHSNASHSCQQQMSSTNTGQPPAQLLTPNPSPTNSCSVIPQKRGRSIDLRLDHTPSHMAAPSVPLPDLPTSCTSPTSRDVVRVHRGNVASQPPESTALVTHATVSQRPFSSVSRRIQPAQAASHKTPSMPASIGHAAKHFFNLDSTTAKIRARLGLSPAAEMRVRWVRDAFVHNDRGFLILHRMFCVWTLQPVTLHTHFGIGVDCHSGFAVLQDMVGSQTALPQELLAFFAEFPNISHLFASADDLNACLSAIRVVLLQLGREWIGLRQACLDRGFPPLPQEIYSKIQCSLTLMLPTTIYNAIEKAINPVGGPHWHSIAYGLFKNALESYGQAVMTHRDAGHGTVHPQALESFGREYKRLLEEYRRHIATGAGPRLNISTQPTMGVPTVAPVPQYLNSGMSDIDPLRRSQSSGRQQLYAVPVGGPPTSYRTMSPLSSSVQGPVIHGRQSVMWTPAPSSNIPVAAPSSSNTRHRPTNWSVMGAAPISGYQGRYRVPRQSLRGTTVTADAADRPRPSLGQHINTLGGNTSGLGKLVPDLQKLPPLFVDPLPESSALHQALAWPPVSRALEMADGQSSGRYYQFMTSFLASPQILSTDRTFVDVTFTVPAQLVERRALAHEPPETSFKRPERFVTNGNAFMHLRCIQLADGEDAEEETHWAGAATTYPQHVFASINDEHLQFRRKRNFRRDLFVDTTNMIHSGENRLVVSFHPTKRERQQRFAVAVESIELFDEVAVMAMPKALPYEEARNTVLAAFQPQLSLDDEVSMAVDSLTIDLVDPYLSTMVKTPVRGLTCKHRECFDLQNYLHSRISDGKDVLTSVDKWLCPFCGRDARPSRLIIDEFLLRVREELESTNLLETRAIVVKSDGSWTVKVESDPQTDDQTKENKRRMLTVDNKRELGAAAASIESLSNAGQVVCTGPSGAASMNGLERVNEVIEIDSD